MHHIFDNNVFYYKRILRHGEYQFGDGKLAEFLNDRQDIDEQEQIKKLQDDIEALNLILQTKNDELHMAHQERANDQAVMKVLVQRMQTKYNKDTGTLKNNIKLIQKQYDECKHTAITKIETDVTKLRKKVHRLENEKKNLEDEKKYEKKNLSAEIARLHKFLAFRTARKPDASKHYFEKVKGNVDLLARLKKEYSEASEPPTGTIPDHWPTNIELILKNTNFSGNNQEGSRDTGGIKAGKDGINYIQLFVNEFKSLHDIPTTNIEAYATEFRSILDEFFLGPPGQKSNGLKRDGWSKSFDAKLRQTSIKVPAKWAGYDIIDPTRE